jgi:DNA-binding transcriptional LysR family regulator
MTNLNELYFFLHVAETGSFTAAAQILDVPKSTVSRGLARLERRLGIRLVVRTTRRITLTEAGEIYLDHCREAMKEVEQAEAAIDAMRATPRGRLRVGAPMLFSRLFLTPLVPEFLTRYPEVHLHLLLGEHDGNLLESNLDLQIQTGHVMDSEMFVRYLGCMRYGIYASPGYISRKGTPASPRELPRHDCITFKEHGPYATWILNSSTEQAEVHPQPRFSAVDSAILHQLAMAHVGITIIPCWLAGPFVRSGDLVRLLPEWEPEAVDISAVYPSPLDLAPNARAFLDFLVERLSFD